jgi:5-methylcytosine-specific restriction endonuclease McrA
MFYDERMLRRIYDRTSGKCHLCGRKLAHSNYAQFGRKGAWEVEHSCTRAYGGSDHLNNLFAAHITCNRQKGCVTTRTARRWNGRKRAPLSKGHRRNARRSNAVAGAFIGALIGICAGPRAAFIGAAIGAALAHGQNTDDQ